MVHKYTELEKRGIIRFATVEDRDSMITIYRTKGFYAEPIGEKMLVASKDKSYVDRIKAFDLAIKKSLGKMVEKGTVKKVGEKYSLVK